MRGLLGSIGLTAAVALLAPHVKAQDKAKGGTEVKENLARLPKLAGSLVNPGSDKGNLVIKVPYLVPQRNAAPKTEHKDVELMPADDMKVRTRLPPVVYDDKGKPRKHTVKELKELKGEGNLPGYQADLGSLKANQTVVVYYSVPKKKPAARDLDKEALEDYRPRVRMVLILAEPQN